MSEQCLIQPVNRICKRHSPVRYIDMTYRLSIYRHFWKISISISISIWLFLKISISISISISIRQFQKYRYRYRNLAYRTGLSPDLKIAIYVRISSVSSTLFKSQVIQLMHVVQIVQVIHCNAMQVMQALQVIHYKKCKWVFEVFWSYHCSFTSSLTGSGTCKPWTPYLPRKIPQ